jgi:spore germination cell wall hydrolase CwlJ-like protein
MVGVGAYQIKDVTAMESVNSISEKEKLCLQQNIFFEARNQSTLGQASVAWVTLNRVESPRYPDSICDVVWQNKQFSWTSDGKLDTPSNNVLEQKAWKKAGAVAESVLLDWSLGNISPVENATMFHADYVKPHWSTSYDRVAQIDSHIFYK